MLLIADSGSTKTDWHFVKAGKTVHKTKTRGLNPYFHTTEDLVDILKQDWEEKKWISKAEKLFFYGAGASSEQRQQTVKSALQQFFSPESVQVNHDLLGAARALCGVKPGIVGILGTGSNTCLYDDTEITMQRGGHGYILSDEGSGNHMGRVWIDAYLNNDIPADLREAFKKNYETDRDTIIRAIYQGENPSSFLARYAEFLGEHQAHPYARQIITHCFERFFQAHIVKYPRYQEYEFSALGSIAYYFSDLLKKVVEENRVKQGVILKAPIEQLVQFHIDQEKQVK